MKKLVLTLEVHDDNDKQKAMKKVSGLAGVDSIAMDMKEKKLTVIGDIDPVIVVSKLKKLYNPKIVSVGPAKEERKDAADPKKKDQADQKGNKDKAAGGGGKDADGKDKKDGAAAKPLNAKIELDMEEEKEEEIDPMSSKQGRTGGPMKLLQWVEPPAKEDDIEEEIDPMSSKLGRTGGPMKLWVKPPAKEDDIERAAMAYRFELDKAHRLKPDMANALYTIEEEASRLVAKTIVCPFPNDRPLLEQDWYGAQFLLIDNILVHELPDSPNSPNLISLQLQKNQDLMTIPSSFFHQMPLLQILDLSYTSIKSLPESLPRLVSLRELILRGCELMMELSPLVGQLHNLEKLDLDQTKILELPETVGNLRKLKFLRFSLFKYEKQLIKEKELQHKPIIHPGILSNLLKLTVLSIDVDPDDERWDETAITMILRQVFKLTSLTYLSLYLPKVELLFRGQSSFYHKLAGFRFTVGHHKDRLISRVPQEVEALYGSLEKCFRLVNGTDYFSNFPHRTVTSFFLDSYVSGNSRCDFFPFSKSYKLKFCIVTECHDMQTIFSATKIPFFNKRAPIFPNLEYLLVYYAKNLKTIWRGPGPATYGGSLSNLRILALHMCPKLSVIFTPDLARSMYNLEELVIEDCPEITTIFISGNDPGSASEKQRYWLPTLRRISLLFLPKLETISNVLLIAPMLGKLAVYYCLQLRNLSAILTQVKPLDIKGEGTWWNGLEWENQKVPSHVQFSEIEKKRDLITQLVDDKFMVLEYEKRK